MSARRTVRVLDEGRVWEFAGRQRRVDDLGEPVAHRSELRTCTATDLRAAFRSRINLEGYGASQLFVSSATNPDQDIEEGAVGFVRFRMVGEALRMRLMYAVDDYDEREEQEWIAAMSGVLAPMLERHRLWIVAVEPDLSQKAGPWLSYVDVGFNTRGRTLGNLLETGDALVELLYARHSGPMTKRAAADLVRAGYADALVGQAEGHWLEAKRQHYDLDKAPGKIALAQAVSRFANADGGLVVIGLETKHQPNGEDLIRRVTPMSHHPRTRRRYRQIIESRIFPALEGLTVEVVPTGKGELVLIDIPAQPEELRPFLVHGAVIGRRADESFISIVRRRGDSSIPTSPQAIHAALVAGRALLRRGQLPQ